MSVTLASHARHLYKQTMTLVVAQHAGNVVCAVSDTGVSEHDIRLDKSQEMPKCVIVSDQLCIAFAGIIDLALKYISEVRELPDLGFRSVTTYFLKWHLESNRQVDFLLLFGLPAPKLLSVKEGKVSASQKIAWIGEKDAFEKFQFKRKNRIDPSTILQPKQIGTNLESEQNKHNHTFDLLGTLRRMLEDNSIPSVFGDAIAVNNVEGKFLYRPYCFFAHPPEPGTILRGSQVDRARAEIAEDDQYSITCFTSEGGSLTGVAIHYVFGKLTYLYGGAPGKPLAMVKIYTDLNMENFGKATEAEYGTWRGTIQLRKAPPSSYGMKFMAAVQQPPRRDK